MQHDKPRTTTRRGGRSGSTLLELMVIVVITGVLAAMAVPSYQAAVEQARVDQAASMLRTIWAAQRFYRLDHGDYATTLGELQGAGLLDTVVDMDKYHFTVGTGGFPVTAGRVLDGGSWSGSLEINETGVITGGVTNGTRNLSAASLIDGQ